MEWTEVEDSLPDDDELKVVRYKDTHYNKHLGISLSRYYLPSNQKTRKYWCFEFCNTQKTKITHWASLPKAPIS
jgi:hypothetical protein